MCHQFSILHSQFSIYYMQLVTPSVVAMAVMTMI